MKLTIKHKQNVLELKRPIPLYEETNNGKINFIVDLEYEFDAPYAENLVLTLLNTFDYKGMKEIVISLEPYLDKHLLILKKPKTMFILGGDKERILEY
jgi:hypothetical protein